MERNKDVMLGILRAVERTDKFPDGIELGVDGKTFADQKAHLQRDGYLLFQATTPILTEKGYDFLDAAGAGLKRHAK
jgi:hypothetical protein